MRSNSGSLIFARYRRISPTVTGTSGNWYQINYNGQTAYIISDYVKMN